MTVETSSHPLLGCEFDPYIFEIDKSQLRLFAKSIGETRPIYFEEAAAKAAGFRSLPAPPTFAFTIAMNPARQFDTLETLSIPIDSVLHAEQAFEYHGLMCAGDRIGVARRFTTYFEKKQGAFRFYVIEARLSDAETGALRCECRQTILQRVLQNGPQ